MLDNAVKQLQASKKQIASQIKALVAKSKQIDQAIKVVSALTGSVGVKAKTRKMSAAGRKAISLAAKRRWAKAKGSKPAKKKGTMSAAGRMAIAAAQRTRWAKIKAAKKK